MEEKHRQALKINFCEIRRDLKGRNAMASLYAKDILSEQDRSDIKSEKTDHDLNEAIMDILPRRGPKAFGVFMEFLRQEQVHLHDILVTSLQELTAPQPEPPVKNVDSSTQTEPTPLQPKVPLVQCASSSSQTEPTPLASSSSQTEPTPLQPKVPLVQCAPSSSKTEPTPRQPPKVPAVENVSSSPQIEPLAVQSNSPSSNVPASKEKQISTLTAVAEDVKSNPLEMKNVSTTLVQATAEKPTLAQSSTQLITSTTKKEQGTHQTAVAEDVKSHPLRMKNVSTTLVQATAESNRSQKEEGARKEAQACSPTSDYNIIVPGGLAGKTFLRTTEYYCSYRNSWQCLQPMNETRCGASAFILDNKFVVCGGQTRNGPSDTMEYLTINPLSSSEQWRYLDARLPTKVALHTTEVYKGKLYVIGGFDANYVVSECIYEVPLKPPYRSQLLAKMPRGICCHTSVLLKKSILILGGATDSRLEHPVNNVLLYNIDDKQLKELAPLPYNIAQMASVKCDDDVLLLGGISDVMSYNVEEGPSMNKWPNMKCLREGCTAVSANGRIIAIGGYGLESGEAKGKYLSSVESCYPNSGSWEFMPAMNEARWDATAAVFPVESEEDAAVGSSETTVSGPSDESDEGGAVGSSIESEPVAVQSSTQSNISVGNQDGQLDNVLADDDIPWLAHAINRDWERVAVRLSFSSNGIEVIKANNPEIDVEKRCSNMLRKWKKTCSSPTLRALKNALEDPAIGRADIFTPKGAKISNVMLVRLSIHIAPFWKELGHLLYVSDHDIAIIDANHPNDVVAKSMALLEKWSRRESSSIVQLVEALRSEVLQRNDLANELEKKLKL